MHRVRRRPLVPLLILAVVLGGCSSGSGRRTGPDTGPSTVASPGTALVAPQSGSASPIASPSAAAGGCATFPADHVWHADVSRLPVHPSSAAWVTSMGADRKAHPDFGSGLIDGAPFGIPVTTVPSGQAKVPVSFEYRSESDPGPYPVPAKALVEGGPNATGDRHVILLDPAACKVWELYAAHPQGDGSWRAGSGAVFDLRSNALRKAGWTSADAAGLSVYAGLVRYDEVAAGRIDHVIRMTAPRTRNSYVWPARHAASSATDPALPPMGAWFRLKASVDVSRFPAQARVVAEALKRHGGIIADNGSPWYISGTQDQRWSNDALNSLKSLTGSDFEAVDVSGMMVDPNSGARRT
jgi:hypothetical protein